MSTLTHNQSCKSLIEHQTEKEPKRQRLTPQQSKNNLNISFDDSELQSIIFEDLHRLINSDDEENDKKITTTLSQATSSSNQ